MARFSYQNSTILLVFKVSHSFYLRSTSVFFQFNISFSSLTFVLFNFHIRFSILTFVLFFSAFVFQLSHSFYSIQHLFYKKQQSFFNFEIRFSSSTFVLSTLVLLSAGPTMNYGRLSSA